MSASKRLPQDFYRRDALAVARDLIGKILVKDDVALRITEVEAYRFLPPPGDSASHGRFGRTARNAPMWGPPGHVYVYVIYGMHPMLNLVTNDDGEPSAVLVRAAEPIEGLATILARRRWTRAVGPALLTGPGKVAQALALDTSFSHHKLFTRGGLELRDAPPVEALAVGPRIGIEYASPADQAAPWRIADAGSRWVAEPKCLVAEDAPAPSGRARIDRGRRQKR